MTSVWEKLVIYLETGEHFETAKHLEMSTSSILERPWEGRLFELYERYHILSIFNQFFLGFDIDVAFEA